MVVHWHVLPQPSLSSSTTTSRSSSSSDNNNNNSQQWPMPREMHSTTIYKNIMLISGGRNTTGEILNDCWILILSSSLSSLLIENDSTTATNDTTNSNNVQAGEQIISTIPSISSLQTIFQLSWKKLEDISLPVPLCSHASYLQYGPSSPTNSNSSSSSDSSNCNSSSIVRLVIVGGITNDGLENHIYHIDLMISNPMTDATTDATYHSITKLSADADWIEMSVISTPAASFAIRFGHTIIPLSISFIQHYFMQIPSYKKAILKTISRTYQEQLLLPATEESIESNYNHHTTNIAALLFGGVDAEQDYGDLWFIV
jgi:hypothetical protein